VSFYENGWCCAKEEVSYDNGYEPTHWMNFNDLLPVS